MGCYDCDTQTAIRRVERHMKMNGKRLYLPIRNGFDVCMIVGFTASRTLRLRGDDGKVFEVSPCRIPLIAFAGVS